jgi:hypothetical protein
VAWSRLNALRSVVAVLAILFALAPGPVMAQMIRGRVVDAQTGAGVELVRVAVSGGGLRTQRMFTTADGRFSFPLRRGGRFRVVRVTAVAHRLDAVTVTGRPRRLKAHGRFYETTDSVNARVQVVGQRRSFRARGSFPTPHLCYHLSGNAHRVESVVTLTVQARGEAELCAAATGGFVYDVTVRRLPPGTYTVRVLYTFQDDVREPVMVLETTVGVR